MTNETEAYFTIALFLSAVFVVVSLAYISSGVKLGKGIPKMRNPPPPPPAKPKKLNLVIDTKDVFIFLNSIKLDEKNSSNTLGKR